MSVFTQYSFQSGVTIVNPLESDEIPQKRVLSSTYLLNSRIALPFFAK